MKKKTINILTFLIAFALVFSFAQPTFAVDTVDEAAETNVAPLIEKENIDITSGMFYDLSYDPEANTVYNLAQGGAI